MILCCLSKHDYRSFTSLNAVANETDIQIPSSRYGFFTNQETVLLVFPHYLVLADTLNVMRIEKCLESKVDCGVPHELVNDSGHYLSFIYSNYQLIVGLL